MRTLLIGMLIMVSCALEAKQRIVIATDLLPNDQRKSDLVSGFVYYITDTLNDRYIFDYQLASREREWRLIEQQKNVCLYNKVRSPSREAIALYSKAPLIVYAPNRLIVTAPLPWDNDISLANLLEDRPMQIGVINGRTYSEQIDKLIEKDSRYFYKGAGSKKAERLHYMLLQNKIDGIIEYSSVFRSRQQDDNDNTEIFVYPLREARLPVKGFFACSRSDIGQQLLDDIDQLMKTSDYRSMAIAGIHAEAHLIEAEYTINALGYSL